MKVLVIGSTGKYAGLVVPALVARGVEVRGAIHDPDSIDVALENGAQETVELDMTDRASLQDAMAGVDGVFLITPAFHPSATEMGLSTVAAAVRAGVRKLVYNGVYHPSLGLVNHAGTRPIEEEIYHSDLDFTVLQPAMYMQALAATYADALKSGEVSGPWSKHAKMSYVDYRDVADVAALAFTDPRLAYGTFELAAGGMVDRLEIAELMSHAAGKTLRAVDSPNDAPDQPEGLGAMFTDYDQHGFHGGNSLVLESILQREPRTVADFIATIGHG